MSTTPITIRITRSTFPMFVFIRSTLCVCESTGILNHDTENMRCDSIEKLTRVKRSTGRRMTCRGSVVGVARAMPESAAARILQGDAVLLQVIPDAIRFGKVTVGPRLPTSLDQLFDLAL